MVRRFIGIQMCVAMLLAFAVAPFEHVHSGDHDGHDHGGLIHAHFYAIPAPRVEQKGPAIDDIDDDHAHVQSLDTYTLVLPHAVALFFPARAPSLFFEPALIARTVTTVEERAHAPPAFKPTVPRAPPV